MQGQAPLGWVPAPQYGLDSPKSWGNVTRRLYESAHRPDYARRMGDRGSEEDRLRRLKERQLETYKRQAEQSQALARSTLVIGLIIGVLVGAGVVWYLAP